MSSAKMTDVYQRQEASGNRKPQPRGFFLTLFCMAVFVLLAKLVLPPIASDGGRHAVWLIGP